MTSKTILYIFRTIWKSAPGLSLLILFSAVFHCELQSQEAAVYETHQYIDYNKVGYDLDLYLPTLIGPVKRETVIFVHGGGFYTGTRKEANIHHYCDSLRQAGFVVANISYRLYLEGQSFHCDQPIPNKIKAIATAAEDVHAATRWLIDHAEEFMIDTELIFLSGSSSGAEAIFEAAYNTSGFSLPPPQALPENFSYAGIMAFAGAAMSLDAITHENALPTLMYHGSCDALVPYGSAIHHYCPESSPGALMLHGSWSIFQHLEKLEVPVVLNTTCGGKHGSAVWPIERDITGIIDFIRAVSNDEIFSTHLIIPSSAGPCKYPTPGHCR